ncbi:hypothetical protein E2C01_082261 [Portunus trituberculatus]|uniref:Uncharacterized protein n=1 Tax=Portunus trituberculatus TaxID=210409 RepID=A0A5B7IRW9_PORTR|nr:hypothetical protein [Portunus trituberculatus]
MFIVPLCSSVPRVSGVRCDASFSPSVIRGSLKTHFLSEARQWREGATSFMSGYHEVSGGAAPGYVSTGRRSAEEPTPPRTTFALTSTRGIARSFNLSLNSEYGRSLRDPAGDAGVYRGWRVALYCRRPHNMNGEPIINMAAQSFADRLSTEGLGPTSCHPCASIPSRSLAIKHTRMIHRGR